MAQTMIVGQIATLAVEGRTDQDTKARLPSPPTWGAEPPGHVILTPSGDQLTCEVRAVAVADLCTVSATSGTLPPAPFDFSILSGAATHLVVSVVTP